MIEMTLPALTTLVSMIMSLSTTNPITQYESTDIHEDLYCLALNAYHEARGVGMTEMMAVSQVVMNRANRREIFEPICAVVTEGPVRESWKTRDNKALLEEERIYIPIKHKCQFSWWCDGRSDIVRNFKGWKDAILAAYLVYNNYGEDKVNGALYYYAHDKIDRPVWAKNMQVTAVLAGHTYLK